MSIAADTVAAAPVPTDGPGDTTTSQISADAPSAAETKSNGVDAADTDGDKYAKQADDDSSQPKHVIVPKPVEVNSVPETPVNAQTPAGGTPRLELQTTATEQDDPDGKEDNRDENAFLKDDDDDEEGKEQPATTANTDADAAVAAAPAPAPAPATTNGKRKAEDEETEANGNGQETKTEKEQKNERPDKKSKVTDTISEKVSGVKEKVESKIGGGRSKKAKAPPAVGRTERKTRSQGPVEQTAQ
ncbi:hypothetical protein GMORB2_7327 [Geosmithia morbida]|uniref:Uncharacterized protein n=1 Tax=Geosmithia morbida TaxID=1094350 RepID=A0A9P4YUK7_9HYPO|nr:uncharacterized protein GMORB2_7327 [Geosmithia morbida]KAF4122335.1 hypothetical protein GMORB2_7327 [Geosmithia morbida]